MTFIDFQIAVLNIAFLFNIRYHKEKLHKPVVQKTMTGSVSSINSFDTNIKPNSDQEGLIQLEMDKEGNSKV